MLYFFRLGKFKKLVTTALPGNDIISFPIAKKERRFIYSELLCHYLVRYFRNSFSFADPPLWHFYDLLL